MPLSGYIFEIISLANIILVGVNNPIIINNKKKDVIARAKRIYMAFREEEGNFVTN